MAETPRRLRRVSGETGMISPGIAGAGTDFAETAVRYEASVPDGENRAAGKV